MSNVSLHQRLFNYSNYFELELYKNGSVVNSVYYGKNSITGFHGGLRLRMRQTMIKASNAYLCTEQVSHLLFLM